MRPERERPGAEAGPSAKFSGGNGADDSTPAAPRKYPAQRAWAERNPLAKWAHGATRSALRKGLLQCQPCAVCGNPKADAHHSDHRRPLEVEWLCRLHHRRLHSGRAQ